MGGATARMPAMIFCGLCVAGRPQGGDVLSLSGLGWQICEKKVKKECFF